MEDEIHRILAKVQAAGYALNPPLSAAGLAEFEARHHIRLPDDYRAFLAIAGDGGTGPYYGISRLADWDKWFEDTATNPDFLAAPCPLVYEQAILPTWADSLPGEWEQWGVGSIHICELGCTYSARLIVSGPSRGRVVYLDANGNESRPYFVKDASFLDWYERWMDLFSVGAKMFWFGMDNPDYPREPPRSSAINPSLMTQAEKLTRKRYVPAIYSRSPAEPPRRAWWQFWKAS